MITVYVPGFPQKSYECRYGDAQIIHDNDNNAIVIDGGEATLYNKLFAYCRNKKINHITYILTHWHYDHDCGMKAFLDVAGICVDKIYCPPPSELRNLQEEGHMDDYNRANRRINLAKSLGKEIVYLPAGKYTDIRVGEIRCGLWRRAANRGDQNDREINNTSVQAYFPDLYYLTGGDMIDKAAFLATKPGKVVVVKGYHHGNGDGSADLQTIKGWGVRLYWYNNVEARGVEIGGSGFSKYGAGKAKGLIETVLRTDSDIVMTAGNQRLKVQKGATVWTFDVPYSGTGVAGWGKGEKGWWYQFEDGSYAVGWKQLAWSKGTDWFYFNENGIMCTGWYWDKDLKAWYYLDPETGTMQKGKAIQVNGSWYYMDGYGRMLTGWHEPGDGYKRYLEPEAGKNQGHMYVSCEAEIDGKTWIFDGYGRASEKTADHEPVEPAKDEVPRLYVIDIASYQSGLDLTKVKVDGVIIKATQGTTYVNPCCNRHYAQAKQAGILRGLYHYASGVGAAAEADAFVRNIQGYVGDALLALDWEGAQNSAFGKNDVAYCKEFLDRVYAITGVRPLIYMSKSVCRAHDWSSVARDYGLWVAQYASMDPTGFQAKPWTDSKGYGAWPYPAIYQYSSHGRLDGYSGNLDLDLAYMTREAWGKYAAAKK